jgi:hypothetical protein
MGQVVLLNHVGGVLSSLCKQCSCWAWRKAPECAQELASAELKEIKFYQRLSSWRSEWDSKSRYGFPLMTCLRTHEHRRMTDKKNTVSLSVIFIFWI